MYVEAFVDVLLREDGGGFSFAAFTLFQLLYLLPDERGGAVPYSSLAPEEEWSRDKRIIKRGRDRGRDGARNVLKRKGREGEEGRKT